MCIVFHCLIKLGLLFNLLCLLIVKFQLSAFGFSFVFFWQLAVLLAHGPQRVITNLSPSCQVVQNEVGKVIHVPIRAGCWQAVNGVWVPRPSHCAGNCEVSWSVCREWRMSWGVQGVATLADEAFIDKNIHTLYSCCQSFEWESLSCRAVKNVEESLMFVRVKILCGALFARTKRFPWRTGGLCACVRTSLTPQAFQLLSASSGQGLKALWSTHTNTVSGPVPSGWRFSSGTQHRLWHRKDTWCWTPVKSCQSLYGTRC